jgi:hypothetical protein
MRALASRFGLSLEVASTAAAYPAGTEDVFLFNGGYYTQAQLNADWASFGWNVFHNATSKAPWPTRYMGGAWSQYAIGQYTQFSGIEPLQQGKIHFAGEGTSMEFQGFMEGAVTTGERVANEIHSAP